MDFLPNPMKCLCCRDHFIPEPRNQHHQRFCSKPDCRRASKRHSQKVWLAKPENKDYFRDPVHSERVRTWRQKHPGYWKNRKKKSGGTLQDVCPAQGVDNQALPKAEPQDLFRRTLQDVCQVQTPLLVGLIAQMIDSPLQEDIVGYMRRMVAKGQDLLDMPSGRSLNQKIKQHDDAKETPSSGATTPSARALQLDRSPADSTTPAP
jgi:hypothetical protein